MQQLGIWFTSLVSFMLLDYIYLGNIMPKFVAKYLGPLSKLKPDGTLQVNYLYGIICYMLMAFALVIFVWPKIRGADALTTAAYCAVAGFIIFGIYDFTQLTFMNYWPKIFAFEDILWGTVSFTITGLIVRFIFKS